MKPGQLVKYYPADNDPAVADRNSAKFFPAIITQTFEGSPMLNLIVFVWNGISPVHSIQPIPEGLDINERHDTAYYGPLSESDSMIDDDADINEKLKTVQDSIVETQRMLNQHAETYATANEAIGKAMNQNVQSLTELVNNYQNELSKRISDFAGETSTAIGEMHKRVSDLEKKKK